MTKITFEVHVEETEAAQMIDALKEIVEELEFPEYLIGAGEVGYASSEKMAEGMPQGIINLDPVPDTFSEWVEQALPDWALDDEDEDETDPCILLPGDIIGLPGSDAAFQVFSIDATGRVILDKLDEVDEVHEET